MGASPSLTYHECLGSGASGTVYRVTWKSKEFGSVEAAAKKIRFDGKLTPGEFTEQQKREIDFLKKLDHKNIIRYYDTVIEKEHVVIVTEFAAKGCLYDYLREKEKSKEKLPKLLLHKWIYHLALGIHYLDQNKVAHCDLKSPNCILTADDILKICDFGIARDLTQTKTTRSAHKGSVKWQAPEIFKDKILSPKAAVYAFGIIVWEMVSCEVPYKGRIPEYVIYNVMVEGLRPTIPNDCVPFLKELIEKYWHQDREKRPESRDIVILLKNEWDFELPSFFFTEEDGLKWKLQHEINSQGNLCFIADDQLAICTENGVEIHHVSKEETRLLHTIKLDEWEKHGIMPWDVAVSEAMPDSILVICTPLRMKRRIRFIDVIDRQRWEEQVCEAKNVYQLLYSGQQQRGSFKHPIDVSSVKHDTSVHCLPCCITANCKSALIGFGADMQRLSYAIYSLPDFTKQYLVRDTHLDLGISQDHLLVLTEEEIAFKPLGDLHHDLDRIGSIEPPDDMEFAAISSRSDARHIYAACYNRTDNKIDVNKYVWDGAGTPKYVNMGCVIKDGIDVPELAQRLNYSLPISPAGLLAISRVGHTNRRYSPDADNLSQTKLFSLE